MQIDTTFPSKYIINYIKEEQLLQFIKNFIKFAWIQHDAPEGFRKVKENKRLSLDLLPKNFDIDTVAETAVKKGVLYYEKIGVINMWINLVITKPAGNKGYKIELDKFSYEKDGHSLKSVIDAAIENI